MPAYVVRRLMVGLNDRGLPVRGRRILLLGLSYKKNTGDPRESPCREVAKQLLVLGADVRAVDSHVEHYARAASSWWTAQPRRWPPPTPSSCSSTTTTSTTTLVTANATYVLDCRRRVDGPNVEHL